MWAGRHQHSPTGVLDLVLPSIESGEIKVVGEIQTVAYERMMQMRPKLRSALETCRVAPLSDAATLELAQAWAMQHGITGDDGTDVQPRIAPNKLCAKPFNSPNNISATRPRPATYCIFLDSTYRRLRTERAAARDTAADQLAATAR